MDCYNPFKLLEMLYFAMKIISLSKQVYECLFNAQTFLHRILTLVKLLIIISRQATYIDIASCVTGIGIFVMYERMH